jgi:hypothetical protein
MKKLFFILPFLLFFCANSVLAQGRSAVEAMFLLTQPSPRANGMAGASVASTESDAIAIAFNPAHLGRMAFDRYFTLELYPSKTNWLPQFAPDFGYDAKTVLFGYNFKRLNPKIPISAGVGYSRIFIDLGEQTITGENDPTPIGTFHSTERAHVWTLGVGIDYVVKAGLGWNFKHIDSNLAPVVSNTPQRDDGQAKANAHDFGMVAYWPIDEVVSRLTGKSFASQPGLRPFYGIGFGYSKNNIGETDAALPRTARIGTSLNAGLAVSKAEQNWRLVSFEHAYEAEDLLLQGNSQGEIDYAGLVGDIDFWDNVILRKGNADIIAKKGWKLSFFEILAIRGGHYDEPGRLSYDTEGFGFSFHGVLKAIRYFNPKLQDDSLLNFLYNHIDIQFESSKLEGSFLGGTEFQGITLSVF